MFYIMYSWQAVMNNGNTGGLVLRLYLKNAQCAGVPSPLQKHCEKRHVPNFKFLPYSLNEQNTSPGSHNNFLRSNRIKYSLQNWVNTKYHVFPSMVWPVQCGHFSEKACSANRQISTTWWTMITMMKVKSGMVSNEYIEDHNYYIWFSTGCGNFSLWSGMNHVLTPSNRRFHILLKVHAEYHMQNYKVGI